MEPVVVAHRGASAHLAEHTAAAYALALEQGADALECDVRLTRDGHLVCVHDRRVDRTSSGRGVVSELTLAELAELDYGGEVGVLTLRALLGMVADHRRAPRLFIETKHPVRYGRLVEERVVRLLAEHGLTRPAGQEDARAVLMSFSTLAVRRFKALAPRLPTVLLMALPWPGLRGGELPAWADAAGPGIGLLRRDPGFVARAARHGHPTYCWTVDDPADVRLCRELGVRWVATNAPAATRAALAAAAAGTVPGSSRHPRPDEES
ncbi:glycerophosphodiester phosphodiesterase [Actinokineospora bangkokensis]|uniref:Glycerophosphodiester phosphodiesterase n=1 Tax=Actinokineospora bangkokensis TaxID=1193682 RepID=A0A1Q9LUD8_9PSEU|nr:glycerophosphodiester phosphodiesterase family protein [Actinokineospora bangkokensis]OLR95594.1 glycerophosphodiester phosphodiesterase [Actinokineospora bangkokensis]